MPEKTVTSTNVRLDEVNLSLLGYDISDAQARLVAEYDGWEKEYQYEIHWSIRGSFQAGEWRDRYDRHPPRIVPFVSVPELGPSRMTHYLERHDLGEKVVKISHRHTLGVTKKPIETSGVGVELSAFDVGVVAYEVTPIGKRTRKIPLDLLVDHGAGSAAVRRCRSRSGAPPRRRVGGRVARSHPCQDALSRP